MSLLKISKAPYWLCRPRGGAATLNFLVPSTRMLENSVLGAPGFTLIFSSTFPPFPNSIFFFESIFKNYFSEKTIAFGTSLPGPTMYSSL